MGVLGRSRRDYVANSPSKCENIVYRLLKRSLRCQLSAQPKEHDFLKLHSLSFQHRRGCPPAQINKSNQVSDECGPSEAELVAKSIPSPQQKCDKCGRIGPLGCCFGMAEREEPSNRVTESTNIYKYEGSNQRPTSWLRHLDPVFVETFDFRHRLSKNDLQLSGWISGRQARQLRQLISSLHHIRRRGLPAQDGHLAAAAGTGSTGLVTSDSLDLCSSPYGHIGLEWSWHIPKL